MRELDDEELEAYSKLQSRVEGVLKKQKTYNALSDLAKEYGNLAQEVNNRQNILDLTDPGTVAIAVQLILSSFEMLEKEVLWLDEKAREIERNLNESKEKK